MLLLLMSVLALGYAEPFDYNVEENHAEERAQQLKDKWGVQNVMRDLDHIREDIREMADLKDLGKITKEEMLFYMIRMHDFDNNGGLDGIEFRVALSHNFEHNDRLDEVEKADKIEAMIENLMKVDDNNDGFIDYAELRKHLDREEGEQQN